MPFIDHFSDEELLIKDTDKKSLFDDLDSPTKTDKANSREKKAQVQKVIEYLRGMATFESNER